MQEKDKRLKTTKIRVKPDFFILKIIKLQLKSYIMLKIILISESDFYFV